MAIRSKVMVAFGVVLAVIVLQAVAASFGVDAVARRTAAVVQDQGRVAVLAATVQVETLQLRRAEKDVFLNVADPAKRTEYMATWTEHSQKLTRAIAELGDLLPSAEHDRAAAMTGFLGDYQAGMTAVVAAIDAGRVADPRAANAALAPTKPKIRSLEESAGAIASVALAGRDAATDHLLARPVRATRFVLTLVVALAALLCVVAGVVFARHLERPLARLVDASRRLAAGAFDTSGRAPTDVATARPARDELEQLERAFARSEATIAAVLAELRQVAAEAHDGRLDARGAADRFDGAYGEIIAGVNGMLDALAEPLRFVANETELLARSAASLDGVSRELGAQSAAASQRAEAASATAEQISRGTEAAAASTGEMNDAIRVVAQNACDSAAVADEAVQAADRAAATMGQLGAASTEIGQVVKTISAITAQTNLLALNATIEAARAGHAGKGFAVVASEVKALARATATATADITLKIETVQHEAHSAMGALAEVRRVIDRIRGIAGETAASIEQQSATTHTMARNVSEAATGAGDVARTITEVASIARATRSSAARTETAAGELAAMVTDLRSQLGRFELGAAA